MVHCEEGADLAHEWSDPEWHGAIDEKLDRLQAFGPTTCEKFQSINPATCAACKYRDTIKSPITLGTRQTAAASGPNAAAPGGVKVGIAKTWEMTAGGAIKKKSYISRW